MVIEFGLYNISFWRADFALFNCDGGFILLFIFLSLKVQAENGKKNKEILMIYLYEFRLVQSAAQTARNLNKIYGKETVSSQFNFGWRSFIVLIWILKVASVKDVS
jgi:hypothetical protein